MRAATCVCSSLILWQIASGGGGVVGSSSCPLNMTKVRGRGMGWAASSLCEFCRCEAECVVPAHRFGLLCLFVGGFRPPGCGPLRFRPPRQRLPRLPLALSVNVMPVLTWGHLGLYHRFVFTCLATVPDPMQPLPISAYQQVTSPAFFLAVYISARRSLQL